MASKPDRPDRAGRPERPERARLNGCGLGLVLLAVAASAACFYFGYSLHPVPVLAWIAPVPVLLVATRTSAPVALGASFAAYLIGALSTAGYYLHSYDVPLPMGIMILVGGAAMFMGVVWLLRRLVHKGRPLLGVLTAPALWTSMMFLTGLFSPIGVIGLLMTTQGDVPVVLQFTSLLGQWALEYAVLMVPLAVGVLAAPGAVVARGARIRTGVALGLVVTLILGFGAIRLSTVDDGDRRNVALVVADHAPWGTDMATPDGKALLDGYIAQIRALPGNVDLVVLPEGGFKADDASLPNLVGPLSTVAAERHADIVVGLMLFTGGKKYNTAYVVPADGSLPAYYARWNVGGGGGSTPGTELAYVPGDPATGLAICGDLNFADPVRDYAADGARLMAVPASDEDVNGRQHAFGGVLRGVQNGMALAWSGQRGTLTLADAYGRIVAEGSTDESKPFAVVTGEVPLGPGATAYTRLGDWFGWMTLGLVVLGLAGAFTPGRGRRGQAEAEPEVREPEAAGAGK